ncbi:MAG: hypothetical protein ABR576_03450 [Thermoanaerobaculia bacterium]
MNTLQVALEDGRTTFRPGEEVRGAASWSLEAPPETVEVRLFWHTQGKGDQDVDVVEKTVLPGAGQTDRREFHFRLPDGPYSFSGKLISLVWSIEVVALPGDLAGRADIVLSPTGREIVVGRPAEG